MNIKNLRSIPFSIWRNICNKDISGRTIFYSYLEIWDGELVKITVACKRHKGKLYCKQVAVHGIYSDECFVRDMVYNYMSGYSVGWFSEKMYKHAKWFEDGRWGKAEAKYLDPYAPVLNLEILEDTKYKYSGYQYFIHEILQMLRLYEKYPCVEYLSKLGLNSLEDKATILRKCSKEKAFCSWLIRNKDHILSGYYTETIIKSYDNNRDLAYMQDYFEFKKRLDKTIHLEFKNDLEKFKSYIEKHNIGIYEYKDYLEACKNLGLDMTEQKNRFPHDFKRWHDIRIDEYATKKALEDAEKKKELYAKFASVAEKYMSLEKQNSRQYIVIIAQSPADLINEGEVLHHCVGRMNYDQKFIREESLIFFVRTKQQPSIPFVTLEYSLSQKKILQCYGDHDSKPDQAVFDYINKKWLPYANNTLKKIA